VLRARRRARLAAGAALGATLLVTLATFALVLHTLRGRPEATRAAAGGATTVAVERAEPAAASTPAAQAVHLPVQPVQPVVPTDPTIFLPSFEPPMLEPPPDPPADRVQARRAREREAIRLLLRDGSTFVRGRAPGAYAEPLPPRLAAGSPPLRPLLVTNFLVAHPDRLRRELAPETAPPDPAAVGN
jgi:hypothetical protein